MNPLGRASALLGVFAGDYAILMLINGQRTDFDVSAGVCAVALLGAALFEYVFRLSRNTLADERAAVWDCVGVEGAQGGHHSRASYRPIEAAERRRLSDRSAGWGCGERVSARRIPCKDST